MARLWRLKQVPIENWKYLSARDWFYVIWQLIAITFLRMTKRFARKAETASANLAARFINKETHVTRFYDEVVQKRSEYDSFKSIRPQSTIKYYGGCTAENIRIRCGAPWRVHLVNIHTDVQRAYIQMFCILRLRFIAMFIESFLRFAIKNRSRTV